MIKAVSFRSADQSDDRLKKIITTVGAATCFSALALTTAVGIKAGKTIKSDDVKLFSKKALEITKNATYDTLKAIKDSLTKGFAIAKEKISDFFKPVKKFFGKKSK